MDELSRDGSYGEGQGGGVDVVDDVCLVEAGAEEFARALSESRIVEDIFVVHPDLDVNPERKHMRILVREEEGGQVKSSKRKFELCDRMSPGGKLLKRTCCAMLCTNSNQTGPLFAFPSVQKCEVESIVNKKNLERCVMWMKKCGNRKLLHCDVKDLHKRFFLCGGHFDERQFVRKNRNLLHSDAVPMKFMCEPIGEEEMSRYMSRFALFADFGAPATATGASAFVSFVASNGLESGEGSGSRTVSPVLAGQPPVAVVEDGGQVKSSKRKFESCDRMSPGGKLLKRTCCAMLCTNSNQTGPLFAFPSVQKCEVESIVNKKNLERCVMWMKKCGNRKLLHCDVKDLHKRFFLCGGHFDERQFVRKNRNLLHSDAVPMKFMCEPIGEEEMSRYMSRFALFADFGAPATATGASAFVTFVATNGLESGEGSGSRTVSPVLAGQPPVAVGEIADPPPTAPGQARVGVGESVAPSSIKDGKRRKCCAVNCGQDLAATTFAFPSLRGTLSIDRVQRFGAWVRGCGNKEILKVSPSKVQSQFFLCAAHFDDDSLNVTRTRLRKDAIPSKFSNQPLSDHEMSCYLSELHEFLEMDTAGVDAGDRKLAFEFEKLMRSLDWFTCDNCNEKHLTRHKKCIHDKKKCSFFANPANDLDPGEVPEELKDLTFIEEQLIAQVHPLVSVFKLKGLQFGYSGNVINFSQDVNSFTCQLPHKIEDLPSVLKVKYGSAETQPLMFKVRAMKVFKALLWLKSNNPYYENIEIIQENIDKLPTDGNVYDQLQSVTVPDTEENQNEMEVGVLSENGGGSESAEEGEENELFFTGLPQNQAVDVDTQIKNNLFDWPVMGDKIDEYKTEGYIACAFPTLFPTGKADLRNFSRKVKVETSDYFKHLLNYKDERFAKHVTFRFFALNSWMRWTAAHNGIIFVERNSEFKSMTISQLKQLLEEKPHLIKKMMYHSSNLRGTRPFWGTRLGELVDMVEQIGLPTFFLTLSCADFHWPDIFRIITGKQDVSDLTEKQRRDILQANPHVIDQIFYERVKCFISEVLSKKFNIKDYWYRIEYQHRGSPHMHGVFWVEDAIDVSNIKKATDDDLEKIAEYFGKFVTAKNPDPSVDSHGEHPCRVHFLDVDQDKIDEDLAQLLARVQRHTKCSPDYCLKVPKKGGPRKCRFKFPFDLQEKASVILSDETGEPEFFPERNDRFLNKFVEFIIQLWRANMDMSPVLSEKLLLQYLAKYISKGEVKSKPLKEFVSSILNEFNEDQNILKALKRLYMRTCSERDYSAQEVCHLLSGRPLYSAGGRQFVTLNFSSKDEQYCAVDSDFDNSGAETNKRGKSVFEKYGERPGKLQGVSLYEACKGYDIGKWSKRRKANIVRIFPKFKISCDDDLKEEYYRQQTLLHVPFIKESEFEEQHKSWKQLFIENDVEHLMPRGTSQNMPNMLEEVNNYDSDYEEDEHEGEFRNIEEFMLAAKMGPNHKVPPVELGLRESDLEHNWAESSRKYEAFGSLAELANFIKIAKQNTPETSQETDFDFSGYVFSEAQEKVILQFENQLNFVKNGPNFSTNEPKLTIIQGKAGTGKSLLIKYMVSKTKSEIEDSGVVLLLAPTGMAALQIGGETVHSALHISTNKTFQALQKTAARDFCNRMQKVKFLIIDEYSMVGCTMLRKIDLRCRQGTGLDEPFGGLFVYLMGDIRQLPPVLDTALFSKPYDDLGLQGEALIQSFEKVFFLSQCFRQQDPLFETILNEVSTGDCSEEHFEILTHRFISKVRNKSDFDNSMHLYAKTKTVAKVNYQKLQALQDAETKQPYPVAKIVGRHNSKAAANADADVAEGLESVVYLSKGCSIMLRKNLWIKCGLVNGAIGRVEDILYDEGSGPPNDFPVVIMCEFANYKGPGIGPKNLVPIPPADSSWTTGSSIKCSRAQFPLALSYACSIYKCQGMTLDKAVIDIENSEFAVGLTYVALSRVKTIDGLLLVPFTFDRITGFKTFKQMLLRLKFETFLKNLAED